MNKSKKLVKISATAVKRVTSVAAAVALTGATIGTAYVGSIPVAKSNNNIGTVVAASAADANQQEIEDNVAGFEEAANDESVYVITDASGKKNSVILSDTKGKDSTQEKNITDEIPVNMTIKYYVDGKEVKPTSMAGKSGHIKMVFSYKNTAKVNSTTVPFVALTGMVLDNEKFSNVEIDNGKVINNGDKYAVVGYALPGLKGALGLTGDSDLNISLPEKFTIEADTTDFELATTMSIVTNEVFNDIDTSSITGKVDTLKNELSELQDGMNKLISGGDELASGTLKLDRASLALALGAQKLNQGAQDVNSGVSQLATGAGKLDMGVDNLAVGSDKVAAGAKQISDQLTVTGNSSAPTFADGVKSSVNSNKALIKGLLDIYRTTAQSRTATQSAYNAAVSSAQAAAIGAGLTDAAQIQEYVAKDPAVNQYAGAKATLDKSYSSLQAQLVASQFDSTTLSYIEQSDDSTYSGILNQIYESKGLNNLESGLSLLKTGADKVYAGSNEITAMLKSSLTTDTIKTGVYALKLGLGQLNDGTTELANGTASLSSQVPTLVSGVDSLNEGANELSSGLKLFNTEGISKLTSLKDGQLSSIADNLRAVINASKSYRSLRGDKNGSNDTVQFIYRSEGISEE